MTGSMPGIIRLSTKDTSFRQKDQIVHRNCRNYRTAATADTEHFCALAGYLLSLHILLDVKSMDAPDECCMAAELTVGGLDGIHGVVKYPDAFLLE